MVIAARNRQVGVTAPPALLDALSERWEALAASATGRVLELPSEAVEEAVRTEGSRGARYDTILSFMRTSQVSDLDSFVAALEQVLAPDGWILMLEPSGTVTGGLRGWLGRGQPERDVVSALRAGGFTVADLHRREQPSAPARWRRYLEIRARRETPIES